MNPAGRCGRFAPSPTGDLHFGSLLAAMASYCQARTDGARWELRIDDIDAPRSVAGAAEGIQQSLLNYALQWDGAIRWQSQHQQRYTRALESLIQHGLVYRCNCSRRSLPAGKIYPGHCRANRLESLDAPIGDYALRVHLHGTMQFNDAVQGQQNIALHEQIGDVIIWRRDKIVSYSLACAVDDATDCTQVVRGADLLPSTAAQIAIMHALQLPVPDYAHIPVAVNADNDKLSKHSRAPAIDTLPTLETLQHAWQFLGQRNLGVISPAQFWSLAVEQWRLGDVPKVQRLEYAL